MAEPASTFPELFARIVAQRAAHDAVVMAEETVSYAELDLRSARMARALLAIGAGKATRIAVLAPDGVFFLTAFYAGLRIGALVVPVSTLATPRELAHTLRNSDAQILVGVRGFLRHDYVKNMTSALPGLADGRAEELRLAGAPYLRSVWLDDATGVPWARPVEDLLSRADSSHAPDRTLLAAVEAEVVPSDDALVVYTSGSTALPKAVVHSQWSVARHPAVVAIYSGLKSDDRTMPLLPAFWMGGISRALQVLSMGGTLVYPASPDTEVVLDTIERFNVTHVAVWHMRPKLMAAAQARGMDVSEIVGLGTPPRDECGGIVASHLRSNQLGMSESFGPHSAEPLTSPLPEQKAGASGRAVNGVERRVVNQVTGEEVPAGEIGELQLRGGALMTGFYKTDRHSVFTPDGFYPTSDMVRIDADGYVYFVGRTGDMIKTNSANVSRLEVEAALQALTEVDLALVAGLPDPELGEIVVAAVVPVAGAAPSEDTLKLALRESLSSFKIPRSIIFISHGDVPRTGTGKVRLFDIASLIASRIEPCRGTEDRKQLARDVR